MFDPADLIELNKHTERKPLLRASPKYPAPIKRYDTKQAPSSELGLLMSVSCSLTIGPIKHPTATLANIKPSFPLLPSKLALLLLVSSAPPLSENAMFKISAVP